MEKIKYLLLVLAVVPVISITAWDYLDGEEGKWIHYVRLEQEQVFILAENVTQEACDESMGNYEGPSWCVRVDGPYRLINMLGGKVP